MIEARITCLSPEFIVEDLGLRLQIGDVEFLSEDRARNSRDLKTGRRAGAVRVEYVQRYTMAKPPKPPTRPLPPHTRMTRQGFKSEQPEAPIPAPPKAAPAPPKEDPRVEALQKEIAELRKVIQDLPGQMAAALASHAGPGVVHQATPTSVVAEDDEDYNEPVFIPSNIVRKEESAEIAIKAGSSKADDLDDAAAALKAAKPKRTRKRSTRKKKVEDSGEG